MALTDEFGAWQDATFQGRVIMSAIAFAINIIMTEDPATKNHSNRARYATAIVNNSGGYVTQLAQGVIALNSATSGASLSDTVINNSVADIWDIYAGLL